MSEVRFERYAVEFRLIGYLTEVRLVSIKSDAFIEDVSVREVRLTIDWLKDTFRKMFIQ